MFTGIPDVIVHRAGHLVGARGAWSRLSSRLRHGRRVPSLVRALGELPVVRGGVESGRPWLELEGAGVFFGRLPTTEERSVWELARPGLHEAIGQNRFRLALDLLWDWLHPRAFADHALLVDARMRRDVFPDHVDFIPEIPELHVLRAEAGLEALRERFALRAGETFIEVGCDLGFSVVRAARECGAALAVGVTSLESGVPLGRTLAAQPDLAVRSIALDLDRGTGDELDGLASRLESAGASQLGLVSVSGDVDLERTLEAILDLLAASPDVRVNAWAGGPRRPQMLESAVRLLVHAGLECLVTPRGRLLAWRA